MGLPPPPNSGRRGYYFGMTNQLAFSTLGCPAWDLDTILTNTVAFGYDAIELRGYLDVMKETLAKVNDTTKIIPGHGDVGTKADLAKQIAMLDGAVKAVDALVKKNRTLEQVIAARPLKPWANYAWSFISEESFTTTLYNGLKQ